MKRVILILAIVCCVAYAEAKPNLLSNEAKKDKKEKLDKVDTEIKFVVKQSNIDAITDINEAKAYLTELAKVIDALVKQTKKD